MSDTSSENLNRLAGVATLALNENSTFPVTDIRGVGLDISNNDGTTALEIEISGINKDGPFTLPFRIPAGKTYNSLYPLFKTLNITTPTTSFDIVVKESN